MEIDGCLSDSCQEDKMSSGNLSPSESQEGGLKRLAMQLAKVIQILFTMLKGIIFFNYLLAFHSHITPIYPVLKIDAHGAHVRRTKESWEDQKAG